MKVIFVVVVFVVRLRRRRLWSVAVASVAVAPGAPAGWYSLPFLRHSTGTGVCGPSHLFWVLAGAFAGAVVVVVILVVWWWFWWCVLLKRNSSRFRS